MVLPVIPCVLVIRRRCSPALDPQEPLHGDAQLRHLLVGLLPVLDGLPDAVLDVVFVQDERDLSEAETMLEIWVRMSTQ